MKNEKPSRTEKPSSTETKALEKETVNVICVEADSTARSVALKYEPHQQDQIEEIITRFLHIESRDEVTHHCWVDGKFSSCARLVYYTFTVRKKKLRIGKPLDLNRVLILLNALGVTYTVKEETYEYTPLPESVFWGMGKN